MAATPDQPLSEIAVRIAQSLARGTPGDLYNEVERTLLAVLETHAPSSDDDTEAWETFGDRVQEAIRDAVPRLADKLVRSLDERAPEMLVAHRADRAAFEIRLHGRWGSALDLTEEILVVAREAGANVNQEDRPRAAEANDFVFDALTRLHARACRIASEVLALLRSGHADGAHARWRSLHEVSVMAFFIRRHSQDVAERFFLHEAVESARAAVEHQRHAEALGLEPIADDEIRQLLKKRDALVERFGRAFGATYGWAAEVLDPERATFAAIERNAGLEHMRPYYRMASHAVHANPKGVVFALGELRRDEILLAGPSNAGLADPGHGVCISLLQVTVALLMKEPTLQSVVTCEALGTLVNRAGAAYDNARRRLEIEEGLEMEGL